MFPTDLTSKMRKKLETHDGFIMGLYISCTHFYRKEGEERRGGAGGKKIINKIIIGKENKDTCTHRGRGKRRCLVWGRV